MNGPSVSFFVGGCSVCIGLTASYQKRLRSGVDIFGVVNGTTIPVGFEEKVAGKSDTTTPVNPKLFDVKKSRVYLIQY